ncbi:MAG: putative DNA binding domain-containing protein [Bacteroidales bacterium]|nr:putative DNA binding domain-containing protein [Bacteroidales bacterium]
MDAKALKRLLREGEHLRLECKRARGGVPNSIWETYSAFANTSGGTILLGVHENVGESDPAKRFEIVGVDDVAKLRNDLWNMLNNPQKVSDNIINSDNGIEVVDVDGKAILVINVPQAEFEQRPIFINDNPLKGSYRRNHEGDYRMQRPMISMMLRDAAKEGNDGAILEHYTMDDLDIQAIKAYRNRFGSINDPDHHWLSLDNKEFLTHLGGYKVDRGTGVEGVTVAGMWMFGKGLYIRDLFSHIRLDYIDYSNCVGEQRYSDRLTYDGRWENNLFNFMTMVLPKLALMLPRPFKMEGVVRIDDTLQHKAVREAFTNMIIHGDLMINGLLRVRKYDDRIDFTNPGLLKLSVEQIFNGSETVARNPHIQGMLRMIGYGENIGSGIPLIVKAWADKGWPRPEIADRDDLMQTTLTLRLPKDLLGQDDVAKDVVKDIVKELTERQVIILKIMAFEPRISSRQMSQRLSVTARSIQRDIAHLQQLHLITREGGKTYGNWLVQEHVIKALKDKREDK